MHAVVHEATIEKWLHIEENQKDLDMHVRDPLQAMPAIKSSLEAIIVKEHLNDDTQKELQVVKIFPNNY